MDCRYEKKCFITMKYVFSTIFSSLLLKIKGKYRCWKIVFKVLNKAIKLYHLLENRNIIIHCTELYITPKLNLGYVMCNVLEIVGKITQYKTLYTHLLFW